MSATARISKRAKDLPPADHLRHQPHCMTAPREISVVAGEHEELVIAACHAERGALEPTLQRPLDQFAIDTDELRLGEN